MDSCRISLAALWLTLVSSVAAAQGSAVRYVLDADSGFTEGCWPPCLCPLLFAESLTGSFDLEFLGTTPDQVDHYAVSAVVWTIQTGNVTRSVTGSGTYEVGGQPLSMERLQLALSIDGSPPEAFDSGLVPGGQDFPRIDVEIDVNGLVCFDQLFELRTRPENLGTSYCGATPTSTGLAVSLSAAGSAVVADQDFLLIAHGAPAGQPGLFFFGPQQVMLPFGDGFRCVGGTTLRLRPPQHCSAEGNALRAVDFLAPPAAGNIAPGTTWNFQFWFRDPAGGPAGFNLSEGLEVDFL